MIIYLQITYHISVSLHMQHPLPAYLDPTVLHVTTSPFQTHQKITPSRKPWLMPCSQFVSGFGSPAHLSKNIMPPSHQRETILTPLCKIPIPVQVLELAHIMTCITLLCKHWFASLTSRTVISGWASVPQWTCCPTCTIMEAVLPPFHQGETILILLCKIPILSSSAGCLGHEFVGTSQLVKKNMMTTLSWAT